MLPFKCIGRQTCDVNVSINGAAIPVVESTRDLLVFLLLKTYHRQRT